MEKTFAPIRDDSALRDGTGMLCSNYQEFLAFQHLYSSAVREIQTRLEDKLSDRILSGQIRAGQTVRIGICEQDINFKVSK